MEIQNHQTNYYGQALRSSFCTFLFNGEEEGGGWEGGEEEKDFFPIKVDTFLDKEMFFLIMLFFWSLSFKQVFSFAGNDGKTFLERIVGTFVNGSDEGNIDDGDDDEGGFNNVKGCVAGDANFLVNTFNDVFDLIFISDFGLLQ